MVVWLSRAGAQGLSEKLHMEKNVAREYHGQVRRRRPGAAPRRRARTSAKWSRGPLPERPGEGRARATNLADRARLVGGGGGRQVPSAAAQAAGACVRRSASVLVRA